MPKSVLQSNWYYGERFDLEEEKRYLKAYVELEERKIDLVSVGDRMTDWVKAYVELEKHGYDQIPTGSTWEHDANFERTVDFARQHIAPERLLGFLQTSWRPTIEQYRDDHLNAIRKVANARQKS